MQRVLDGPPRPPSAAAGWTASVEVSVAHRPVALDGRLHPGQHLRVPAEPVGPAGVPDTIVEHGARPPRVTGRGACRERDYLNGATISSANAWSASQS